MPVGNEQIEEIGVRHGKEPVASPKELGPGRCGDTW